MGKKKGVLWVIVGLMLAVGAGGMTYMLLTRATTATALPIPAVVTAEVVVTLRDLPAQTLVQAADVGLKSVPTDVMAVGSARRLDEVVGKLTLVTMTAGEMVHTSRVISPTEHTGALNIELAEGKVVMAFPTNDLMSSLNLLQVGDHVDILVSLRINRKVEAPDQTTNSTQAAAPAEDYPITFDALQNTRITAIIAARPEGDEGDAAKTVAQGASVAGPKPAALLLALDPQDALALKSLKDAGDVVIDIVLRAPTDTQLYETQPVDLSYVLDRYGIRRSLLPSEPVIRTNQSTAPVGK